MKALSPKALSPAVLFFLNICALGVSSVEGKDLSYQVTGKFFDTCACHVSCSCGVGTVPLSAGHCDDIILLQIEKGNVGAVSMDGLEIALVGSIPDKKTGWSFITFYLDDRATPQQKKAMPQLLAGLFGAKSRNAAKPPQWVPMNLQVQGDTAKFEIASGHKLSFEIENVNLDKTSPGVPRSDPGNRITVTNAGPYPWVKNMTQGYSKSFHYSDLGVQWDYKERNAFFGRVKASGTVPVSRN